MIGGADLDDRLGRAAHEAWKLWIVGQGYACHAYEPRYPGASHNGCAECAKCTEVFETHHPDMVDWSDLPDAKRGKYVELARAGYTLGHAAGSRDAEARIEAFRIESLALLCEVSSWGEAIDAYIKNGDGDGAIITAQAIGENVNAAELRLAALHGVEWTGHAWELKTAPKAHGS